MKQNEGLNEPGKGEAAPKNRQQAHGLLPVANSLTGKNTRVCCDRCPRVYSQVGAKSAVRRRKACWPQIETGNELGQNRESAWRIQQILAVVKFSLGANKATSCPTAGHRKLAQRGSIQRLNRSKISLRFKPSTGGRVPSGGHCAAHCAHPRPRERVRWWAASGVVSKAQDGRSTKGEESGIDG